MVTTKRIIFGCFSLLLTASLSVGATNPPAEGGLLPGIRLAIPEDPVQRRPPGLGTPLGTADP